MKAKLKLLAISWLVIMASVFPKTSVAQTDSAIQSTGVLKVGIRRDSPLIGFASEGNWTGYCVDIANALAKHLSRNRIWPLKLRNVSSTTQSRWDLVRSGEVHLECGPNTIAPQSESEYGVRFSAPFFVTATQILTRPGTSEPQLTNNNKIGVIYQTTNERDIQSIYPSKIVDNTFAERDNGINAVIDGDLTGFASDGILLLGSANSLNLSQGNDYTLLTPQSDGRPLCATYGIILPGGQENARWRDTVNFFIVNNPEARRIWGKWFGEVSDSVNEITDACQ